ncbi:MAG: hypothetical protein AB7N80_12315 [Bdellovibrionales bacterium]
MILQPDQGPAEESYVNKRRTLAVKNSEEKTHKIFPLKKSMDKKSWKFNLQRPHHDLASVVTAGTPRRKPAA